MEMKHMKLWDWVVWNQRLKWTIIEYFMPSKKYIFFFCMYKMLQISNEEYKNAKLKLLTKEDTFG